MERFSLRRSTLSVSLLLGVVSSGAIGQECHQAQYADREAIGLALGGGGARGYAHVGVMKALEEMRIPVDYIAGTSMGSIVGALAASGMDSAELDRVVRAIDWGDLFDDETPRPDQPIRRKADDRLGFFGPALGIGRDSSLLPTGLLSGQKILNQFETLTSSRTRVERFADLPIPFQAVATDLVTGELVILDAGALSLAMRASMSVPGVFDPIELDGRLLVDGGLVRNLPVDVVRTMGAERVIAVNVGTPLRSADRIKDVLSVMDQMIGLAINNNTLEQIEALGADDLLIQPELDPLVTSAAFDRYDIAWQPGYEATMRLREELAPLALSDEDYRRWRASVEDCERPAETIRFVRLDNRSRFSDAVIEKLITIAPGDPLETGQLDRDLRQIHALGFIQFARYQLVEEDGETGLVIEVLGDERGTDLLQTGMTLAGNAQTTNVNLRVAYLKTDIGDRGSELRGLLQIGDDFALSGDLWHYLDDGRRWIFNPELVLSSRDIVQFDEDGRARSASDIESISGSMRVGYEIGRSAALFAGLRRYVGDVDPNIGRADQSFGFDGGEWFVSAIHDRLDDPFLPTRGQLLSIDYTRSESSLGADADFEQLRAYGLLSRSHGRHNVAVTGRFSTTLDDDAPVYALFTAGGFFNMSGFEPAQLVGQHVGFVGLGYRYEVIQSGFLPGYVGGTVEYGNAADRRADVFGEGILNGSLYVAYSTPLGPFYLGYGWNEDRNGVVFLRLGAAFGSENVARR